MQKRVQNNNYNMDDFKVYYSKRKYLLYIFTYAICILGSLYEIFNSNSYKEILVLLGGIIYTYHSTFYWGEKIKKK